jgi:hypothetical protein
MIACRILGKFLFNSRSNYLCFVAGQTVFLAKVTVPIVVCVVPVADVNVATDKLTVCTHKGKSCDIDYEDISETPAAFIEYVCL